jgi:prepilin-type processing-associated H-X9-DG protein
MSAIDPKQTWALAVHMSAFVVAIRGKADIAFCDAHVCF